MLDYPSNQNSSTLKKIPFYFINKTKKLIYGHEGETVLTAAHKNKIDLEGACEGSLACSTCHVILDKNIYDKLNNISDREYDLLDQAYGLTSTSRLGCQIEIDDRLKNAQIKIPRATRNMAIDGYIPKPH
ncbi:hypothetical protein EDEG_03376 [Edhazardia aedis USNM 41457]|uniref:2Fe-2S ferredoxin-type domain-containing protein n=1 Tax=Edhazardia aedis (strain USNM 41457) TaxID=1003232 RepID=J9DHT8_EDHAE|nr:hypothetical protein EDEG_03376 [Edhazardia aedis USNM 41457]|eukprot:EJW02180.1 hypothetical protein EDEG_03376 [Edhazardia aedis USNM 41457]